nr:unnamed protein product [Callosobruchus chinensis]
MPRNELSAFDRTRIIAPWQEGLSRHQTANRLNVVRSTVSRTIIRYEESGEVNSSPRTGRPTVSTRREDRYIAQLARRTISRCTSTKISIPENVLASKSFGVRIEVQKAFKGASVNTARHRTARLQWARPHQDWLLSQWRNVLFSDEFRFGLIPGTMPDTYYLQNISNATVQLLRNEVGDQFNFIDDDARPHRTRAVQQALENGNIAR